MYKFEKLPLSYWLDSTEKTNYNSLSEDLEVDVAIVGGGIAGITSAFLLKRRGLKVAILEVDKIIEGTTARTTAKVTTQHGLFYNKLVYNLGITKAKQYADANQAALSFIKNIIEEKNINCDFSMMPSYVYTEKKGYIENIKKEVLSASNLGIDSFFVKETPLPFEVKGAIRFDNQAQFHPRKYLLELAYEIDGNGSHIFENTKVIDIKSGDEPEVITESGYKVKASSVIIASHYPIENLKGLFFSRVYTERAYIVGALSKDKFPEGMYINAESPTRSLRRQKYKDKEIILIAGENHKTGQGKNTDIHYENLINFGKNHFDLIDIPYRWSTQDIMPMDDIPFIGKLTTYTKNIYIATGFKKWGMTNGTAAGMILTDIITEGYSPYSDVFDPSRLNIKGSFTNFLKENLNVGIKFVEGKIAPKSKNITLSINEGKVIEYKGKRVGIYKDNTGRVYMVDTTCTHLGCELEWNKAEKSWDCPCHGSRFSYDGNIIEGPALKKLNSTILKDEDFN